MWWPTQCEEVRADEDEEEVGIEERTLPYVPIETDGLKEARQQDPEHESDGHAEQQRREEHAGEVDLADHDAGIHAGARSNSAMRSPASERIARVTGLLFRSEEHTSELQSLMRISYAVFCLKKKTQRNR